MSIGVSAGAAEVIRSKKGTRHCDDSCCEAVTALQQTCEAVVNTMQQRRSVVSCELKLSNAQHIHKNETHCTLAVMFALSYVYNVIHRAPNRSNGEWMMRALHPAVPIYWTQAAQAQPAVTLSSTGRAVTAPGCMPCA